MEEVVTVLDYGIVERRFYDEYGKLVDIRKEYPPQLIKPDKGHHLGFVPHPGRANESTD